MRPYVGARPHGRPIPPAKGTTRAQPSERGTRRCASAETSPAVARVHGKSSLYPDRMRSQCSNWVPEIRLFSKHRCSATRLSECSDNDQVPARRTRPISGAFITSAQNPMLGRRVRASRPPAALSAIADASDQNRPDRKSAIAWPISSRVFMTNGPYLTMGSRWGRPATRSARAGTWAASRTSSPGPSTAKRPRSTARASPPSPTVMAPSNT